MQLSVEFIRLGIGTKPNLYFRAMVLVCGGSPKVWDNLWESRGGSMVNGAPRKFPESTQCIAKRCPEKITSAVKCVKLHFPKY